MPNTDTSSPTDQNDHCDIRSEYMRVRSAPPQDAPLESSSPQFLLCNMDGTPLVLNEPKEPRSTASSHETSKLSMEEEVNEVLKRPASPVPDPHLFEESSSEIETESSEFDQFLQIEELISRFPAVSYSFIKSRVSRLLSKKERTPIPISFVTSKSDNSMADKLRALREKEDTSFQKVRNEFNRVTALNQHDVVDTLKKIKVQSISEMQEIAGFVLGKAISEPVYLKIYTQIIGELKKEWKCEEELSLKGKKQTCFFGTLLRYLFTRVSARQNWSTDMDISTVKANDRAEFERILEDYETERLKKKKHATGTIDLVSMLYLQGIIGPANVILAFDELRSASTPENVELACKLLTSVCKMFVENGKVSIVEAMYDYLSKNKKKHGIRLEYLIDTSMKYAAGFLTSKQGAKTGFSSAKNSFAELAEDNEVGEQDEETQVREYVYDIASKAKMVEDDGEDLIPVIRGFLKQHSSAEANKQFFTAYVVESVTNPKAMNVMQKMLVNELHRDAQDFRGSLEAVKSEYAMLRIDFPKAPRYYSEFLCILRASSILTAEEFEHFKPHDFPQLAAGLMRSWRDSNDSRLSTVFSSEDLKVIS